MRMRFIHLPDPGRPFNTEPRSAFVAVFDQFDSSEVDKSEAQALRDFACDAGAEATLIYAGTLDFAGREVA